ncbi:MAG: hypothetical protein DYH17_05885 [Xanthomonadales bacterium PRO6]|nr:hypothetical protein [Xanthomonadales bacterium PRO6]
MLISVVGLTLGLALSAFPQVSRASYLFGSPCERLCWDLFNECVAERGTHAGCGRERENCYRFCRTGRL